MKSPKNNNKKYNIKNDHNNNSKFEFYRPNNNNNGDNIKVGRSPK